MSLQNLTAFVADDADQRTSIALVRSIVTDEGASAAQNTALTATKNLPEWAPHLIETGTLLASSFLSANRAGNNERRPLSSLHFAANLWRFSEKSRGRALAMQPLSDWATVNPVSGTAAISDGGGLLRRAQRDIGSHARLGPSAVAATYAVAVNTAKTAESTSERYYTLLWDSADVLGFEEKQARARLWRRTTQSGGVYERAYGEVDDSALLFLAFDYMHTRNNIASGVREIVTTTHKVSRAALGAKVARAAQLAPADAFSEPEWHAPLPAHPPGDEAGAEAPPDQLTLKAHFDVKFGLLWVLLRHLFFGADAPDLALPAAWCTQFKESASRKLHLSPEMIERALTPLSSAEFLAAGVGQLFVTGVSHGASLAQAFHMYFNRAKSMAGHPLKIYSVHYGAYRWTDAHGAALFRALTRGDEAGGKHAEAVAISASDGNTQGVVDPIPRINWRAGGCFQRRGYENVVDPVVIAADTGAVDVMAQGALQERRICCGALDAHFHMASTYRGAVKHLTHAAQSTSRARRESRQARGEAASFQASREKIKARLGALRTFVRKSRRPSVDENDIAPTIVKVDEPA